MMADVLRAWGLQDEPVRFFVQSFNTLHRVGEAYVLRLGPRVRIHRPGCAESEAGFTATVAAAGIASPEVIRTLDGRASIEADGREAMVLRWVDGEPLPDPLSLDGARKLGRLAATLHDLAPQQRPDGALDADDVLLFVMPDRLGELRPRYGAVFTEAYERARQAIDGLTGPRVLLHGDLGPRNVVRGPSGLVAIDYQDVMWGRVEQDLAHTLYSLRRDDADGSLAEALRAGYASVRQWPDVDPGLLVARRLQMVNQALNSGRTGLNEYLDRHADALRG